MTRADRLARSFGRSFQSYGRSAKVQRVVARALARELARAGAGSCLNHALEFGVGSGALTRALAARFDVGRWTLNDLYPAALDAAPVSATPLIGLIEEQPLPKGLDLVASASTLQWVENPRALLEKLGLSLASGGWLALSTFGPAQFRELTALGSHAQAPSYLVEGDLLALLPEGIAPVSSGACPVTLWFDSPRDVLRHLRDTGVNGMAEKGWTRSDLQDFEGRYTAQFGTGGRVPLTYDPVWVIGRKA